MSERPLLLVNEALSSIRQGLEADGYQLEVRHGPNGLVIRVIATQEACVDCLSPKEIMYQMVRAGLEKAGMGDLAQNVRIEYPHEGRTDNPALHSQEATPPESLIRSGLNPEKIVLTAQRHGVQDLAAAIDYCFEQGWTDGLPVIPPTPDRVRAMLAAGHLPPDTVLGRIPERQITIRVEQVAINAVMAGCLPEYMPVVIAAVRSILDPAFKLHGPSASMAGTAFLIVVNGPYAKQIGMNSGENLFGPGNRANATIGRAVRLLLMNAGGRQFDRSTFGHPGKYTYCIAEQEDTGWDPLHVVRGFPRESSAVTVMAAEAPHQVNNHVSRTPDGIMATIVSKMVAMGSMNANDGGQTQMAIIISPEFRRTFQDAGLSKQDVTRLLWERAQVSLAERKRAGVVDGPINPGDEELLRPVTPTPEDLLVITAGGQAGRFAAVIPGWGRYGMSWAVTTELVLTPSHAQRLQA